MKAYVIKNKDGKYLAICSSDYSHYWTSIDFAHYFRYLTNNDPKHEAEDFKNRKYPDCEKEYVKTERDLNFWVKNKIAEMYFGYTYKFDYNTNKWNYNKI